MFHCGNFCSLRLCQTSAQVPSDSIRAPSTTKNRPQLHSHIPSQSGRKLVTPRPTPARLHRCRLVVTGSWPSSDTGAKTCSCFSASSSYEVRLYGLVLKLKFITLDLRASPLSAYCRRAMLSWSPGSLYPTAPEKTKREAGCHSANGTPCAHPGSPSWD
jgi:hypothetical protein